MLVVLHLLTYTATLSGCNGITCSLPSNVCNFKKQNQSLSLTLHGLQFTGKSIPCQSLNLKISRVQFCSLSDAKPCQGCCQSGPRQNLEHAQDNNESSVGELYVPLSYIHVTAAALAYTAVAVPAISMILGNLSLVTQKIIITII
jgi:hypothetical protein